MATRGGSPRFPYLDGRQHVIIQKTRDWVWLHEKGGKRHEMPCHHNLKDYLRAYVAGQNLRDDSKDPLFRAIGRDTDTLTRTPLLQANAKWMIGRRARAAGIETRVGKPTFWATGFTADLKDGGTLERSATMASHASTRNTQLHDRRSDVVSLDEVERILVCRPPASLCQQPAIPVSP